MWKLDLGHPLLFWQKRLENSDHQRLKSTECSLAVFTAHLQIQMEGTKTYYHQYLGIHDEGPYPPTRGQTWFSSISEGVLADSTAISHTYILWSSGSWHHAVWYVSTNCRVTHCLQLQSRSERSYGSDRLGRSWRKGNESWMIGVISSSSGLVVTWWSRSRNKDTFILWPVCALQRKLAEAMMFLTCIWRVLAQISMGH
jgi:hypothetical protein